MVAAASACEGLSITEVRELEAQLDCLLEAEWQPTATVRVAQAPTPPDDGFDPAYEQKARAVLELLYSRYYRVEVVGVARVPARGRCLLVARASHPLHGAMINTAVKLEHPAPRDVRWLAADGVLDLPLVGPMMSRLGLVRSSHENAERLLESEHLCAQRVDHGDYLDLCLRTRTPVVPVAVLGTERWRIEFGEPIDLRRVPLDLARARIEELLG